MIIIIYLDLDGNYFSYTYLVKYNTKKKKSKKNTKVFYLDTFG